jgi:hypothetical protein
LIEEPLIEMIHGRLEALLAKDKDLLTAMQLEEHLEG